ncbi:hypothetical protein J1605_019345 [Eschrichtius robustus]|uniref:Endophilin-B1 n=2 Tax=Eschrichtius robustus TaxID=9764 RepID=A0AB34HL33_ESCRO|nr:hypothetical protein J1605_019345 [Eschrichtius robustus]
MAPPPSTYHVCPRHSPGAPARPRRLSLPFRSAGSSARLPPRMNIMDFNVKKLAADAGTFLSRAVQVPRREEGVATPEGAREGSPEAAAPSAPGFADRPAGLLRPEARVMGAAWCPSGPGGRFPPCSCPTAAPGEARRNRIEVIILNLMMIEYQFTEEKLGQAEKTELDAHLENLLSKAECTKVWTEKIMKQTEVLLQPNPNARIEEFVYEKLDRKAPSRINNPELLGQYMIDAGTEFGPGTAYGNALIKCGETQKRIGTADRELIQTSALNFLTPLRNFIEGDYKTIAKERKLLQNKRLDLDAAKTRLKKAKAAETRASSEQELRITQSEFDRQAEITRLLLEGISSTHAHHLRCLNDFVEAQMTYYAQCYQYMLDLQKQLGSFPSIYHCNNNQTSVAPIPSASSNVIGSSALTSASGLVITSPSNLTDLKECSGSRKARVLYDYDAANSTELSLLADEVITVFSVVGMDSDWLMGERGNQKGRVPITYLELLN